ncbi:hypothetical protein WA158_000870 [Blastocystis sp. Blastoise]
MDFSNSNHATFKFNFFANTEKPQIEVQDQLSSDESRKKEFKNIEKATYLQNPNFDALSTSITTPLNICGLKYVNYEGISVKNTDIIPGKYEGGHTVWHGAIDLVNYLNKSEIPFSNKNVIELGCGHGLPGIYALQHGAKVIFQDLNEDTLLNATSPAIAVNCNHDQYSNCKLIKGEWGTVYIFLFFFLFYSYISLYIFLLFPLLTTIPSSIYTLYSPETVSFFINLLVPLLSSMNVTCYCASQRYYFGVGGGYMCLLNYIQQHNLPLNVEIIDSNNAHNNVLRDIYKITKTQ